MYLILFVILLFVISQIYFSIKFFYSKNKEETTLKKFFIGFYLIFQLFFSLWFILFIILGYLGSIKF